MDEEEVLAANVRRLRREKGLTVAELADRVGVSRPTIWSWEKGKTSPRASRIPVLAASLQVPESELILDEAEMKEGENKRALQQEIARSKERIAALAHTSARNVEITIKW